ncbi:MAG: preprotein translocase subunit SecG [bacterium]
MQTILSILQIIVSIALIATILFQQSSGGGSAIFGGGGGGGGGGNYYTKRGLEKILFNATIVLAVLFIVLSFINLFI